MRSPVSLSVLPKSRAMSERSPIGTNSEVLKIKAARVRPISAAQCLAVIRTSSLQETDAIID